MKKNLNINKENPINQKSQDILKTRIRKDLTNKLGFIKFIDITDTIANDKMIVFDCMVEDLGLDFFNDVDDLKYYFQDQTLSFRFNPVEFVINKIISYLEADLKIIYGCDTINVNYEIYDITDNAEEIRFVLSIDLIGDQFISSKYMLKSLVNQQLSNISEYLN